MNLFVLERICFGKVIGAFPRVFWFSFFVLRKITFLVRTQELFFLFEKISPGFPLLKLFSHGKIES